MDLLALVVIIISAQVFLGIVLGLMVAVKAKSSKRHAMTTAEFFENYQYGTD